MSEDKPKRTYAKASYKTKPYAVRFDIEKFDFFMSREKLKTAQQLVDHFLNGYWWQWKVAKPTHKDVPPVNTMQDSFKGILPHENGESTAISHTTKQALGIERSFQQFMNEIPDLQYEDEFKKFAAEIEAATNISRKQKDLLLTNMRASKL